jgi:predicted nucleic acid-binding protein
MGLTILDAGVLIAAFDDNDLHAVAASDALRQARDRGDELSLPASAYAELLVRPTRRGPSIVARYDEALDAMGISVEIVNRDIARAAAVLRARHRSLRLPDALAIATAIHFDADHLLTTDRGWRRLRLPELRASVLTVGAS